MGWKDAPLAKATPQASWQSAPLVEAPKPQGRFGRLMATGDIGELFFSDEEAAQRDAKSERVRQQRETVAAARRADVAKSDGFLDRAGDLLLRGAEGAYAGIQRVGQAIGRDREAETYRRVADASQSVAATAAPGEATFEEAKQGLFKGNLAKLGQFVVEQGTISVPGMAAALLSPGTYLTSQVGNIGEQRAANNGRDIEAGDLAVAAPFAAASTALERLGLSRIFAPGAGNALVRTGKAAAAEGLTEAGQSQLEYTGGSLGTDVGYDLGTGIDQTLAGMVTGAAVGGAARGGYEAGAAAVPAVANAPAAGRTLIDALRDPTPVYMLEAPQQAVAPAAEANAFADLVPTSPEAANAPAAVDDPQPVDVTLPSKAPVGGLGTSEAPTPDYPEFQRGERIEYTTAKGETVAATVEGPFFIGDQLAYNAKLDSGTPTQVLHNNARPVAPAPKAEAPAPAEPRKFELSDHLPRFKVSEPLQEGEKYVRTPAGNRVRTRFEVVDASALNKAEGRLQNRDRSRETTTLQVQDIISKFEPEMLGDDPSSDRGAPVVGQDSTVLSGNGRMLALNAIYDQHPEKAAQYRAFIEAQGHSTEGMERPVLVRRVTQEMSEDDARQFVVESNKDTKLELSPVERAKSDADNITPQMLSRYAGGDLNSGLNRGFIEGFAKTLTVGEMGNFIGSDRRLTTAGLERVENAVIAAAYDSPKLLERIMENPVDDIRAISSSLADVAPAWAKMRQAAKAGEIEARYDITGDLADAAARVSDARKQGAKIADVLTQQDAFDAMSPVTAEFIKAFYNGQLTRAASRKSVTELLNDYVKEATAQQSGDGLFGAEPGKAPVDILRELLRRRDNPNGAGLDFDRENANERVRAGSASTSEERRSRATRGLDLDAPGGRGSRGSGSVALDATDEPGLARGAADPDGSAQRAEREDQGSTGARAGGKDQPGRRPTVATGSSTVDDQPAGRDLGRYSKTFDEASYTDRQSVYRSAIDALGMDEAKFNLLKPARKVRLLAQALEQLTGVKVEVTADMPLQHAIDQLLDAHQTLQGMAYVLGIPSRALSLGGNLKLKLLRRGNFLGAYSHGDATIMLPKRSNSFGHEWGHALDYYLLDKVSDGEMVRGLSGLVRDKGGSFQPKTVQEAFVKLMNAMFFDGAEVAAKIMRLQQSIEKTSSEKQKAALQKQIDNLLSGRARAKEKSRYWKGADAFNKRGGEGDYWTRPTEMLARAFEAWLGFKMANEGFGTEFVNKGNDAYLSDVEDRFKLTFPKGEERLAIFDAFQKLIDVLNMEQMIEAGGDVRGASGFNDVATPEMQRVAGVALNRARRTFNPLAADFEAVQTWFHNRDVDKEESQRRGGDPMRLMQKANNVRSLFFSAAADGVKMVATRWKSPAAMTIHDHFAHDLGGTRHVTRAWGDAVEMRENKALNPVFKQLEKVGGSGWVFKKLTREQNDVLAALLNGEEVADSLGLEPLANAMRRAFNDEWYENQKAGIDLGYVRDTAYLNRQIDRELVAGNPDGFVEQAVKVYEIVFDRDVGEDAPTIAEDDERLALFLKLATKFEIDGVKELKAAIKAVKDGGPDGDEFNDGGDPEEITNIITDMFDEVRAAFAANAASEYRDAILNAETFADYTVSYALPDAEKKRSLPAQADRLLRDFYNPSPVSALVNYIQASVRRTEWNKRLGKPAGTKKSAPSIAKQLDEQMAAEGVPASDRQYVWSLVDRMSGRYQRKGLLANPYVAGTLGLLRVKGTLAMMGRAVTLSLFEPASLGVVTHNPVHGVKAVARTWGNVLLKGQREQSMEWARAQGFIKHHLLEQFQTMDRFGTTADTPTRWDRLSGALFRNTGLTWLTAASDAAVIDVGRRAILDEMAHRVARGGNRGKEAANLMRELGIRDPDVFAREVVALGGALPGSDWLNGKLGYDYNTALMRLAKYAIQKPGSAELVPMSRNPLASYATYSITAYIQSAYRNMLKRNINKGLRMARNDPGALARMFAGTLLSAGLLYALQFLSSVTREYLFNPERQEQWEHEDAWLKNNAMLAANRTFSFGWGDPVVNAWTGLRYNRDFAYIPLGAYAGQDAKNLTAMAKVAANNSKKNNTAEHNALSAFYGFALSPLIAGGIQAAPGGGPIATTLSGAATATTTGPIAADAFATAIVGEKNGRLGPDGKKIKSGPTALDEFVAEHFPEEEDEDD